MFAIDDRVRVTGLASPQLNGREGTVITLGEMIAVRLDGDERMLSLKPRYLEHQKCCAQCQQPLAAGAEKKCGMCAKENQPDPAYYCSKECAKAHWKAEHKAWHGDVQKSLETMSSPPPDPAAAEEAASKDEYTSLCGQARQANSSGNHRKALKLTTKAIKLFPERPTAHYIRGMACSLSGDMDNAVAAYSNAVDRSDKGTPFNNFNGDSLWAQAVGAAAMMNLQSVDIRNWPPWLKDLERAKAVSNRALASQPNNGNLLQFRATVYSERSGLSSKTGRWEGDPPSADDLCLALSDRRRFLGLAGSREGGTWSPGMVAEQQKSIARLEGQLRQEYFMKYSRLVMNDKSSLSDLERAKSFADKITELTPAGPEREGARRNAQIVEMVRLKKAAENLGLE